MTLFYSQSELRQLFELRKQLATAKIQFFLVAGFANGTTTPSLVGFNLPSELLVDAIGNMFIADALNYRILYWPLNAAEGHIVAGNGSFGSSANQFDVVLGFTGDDLYCLLRKHV